MEEDQPDYEEAREFVTEGNKYFKKKDFNHATTIYVALVHYYPEYQKGWNNLGKCYQKRGYFKKAISCYEKALALKPSYEMAQKNLERIQEQIDADNDSFKEDFKKALKSQIILSVAITIVFIIILINSIIVDLGYLISNSFLFIAFFPMYSVIYLLDPISKYKLRTRIEKALLMVIFVYPMVLFIFIMTSPYWLALFTSIFR